MNTWPIRLACMSLVEQYVSQKEMVTVNGLFEFGQGLESRWLLLLLKNGTVGEKGMCMQ